MPGTTRRLLLVIVGVAIAVIGVRRFVGEREDAQEEAQPGSRGPWRIEGSVLGPDGAPVPRADVFARGEDGAGDDATVAQGRFALTVPTRHDVVRLHVTNPRDAEGRRLAYQPHVRQVRRDGSALEVRLEPGLVLWGEVVDPHGRGAEDVEVVARPTGAGWFFTDPISTRTGTAGRFALDGLGEGLVRVTMWTSWRWELPLTFEVEAGRTDVRVVLEPTPRLGGEVRAPDGGVVSGALVVVSWGSGFSTGTSTDDRGWFVSGRVGAPPLRLKVEPRAPPGEVIRYAPLIVEGLRVVDFPAPPLRLQLPRGHDVVGTVTDEAGLPVAGAEIVARDPGFQGPRSTRSDTRGAFRIEALRAAVHRLEVTSAGHYFPGKRVEAPARDVSIVLAPGRRLQGQVVGRYMRNLQVSFHAAHGGAAKTWRTEVDASGAFTLDVPRDAAGMLYARAEFDDRFARVEIPAPDEEPLHLVVEPGLRIAGRVAGGTAARGEVVARGADGLVAPGYLGAEGRFVVRGLPPGEYVLEAEWLAGTEHHRVRLESVAAGTEDLVLTP